MLLDCHNTISLAYQRTLRARPGRTLHQLANKRMYFLFIFYKMGKSPTVIQYSINGHLVMGQGPQLESQYAHTCKLESFFSGIPCPSF